MLYQNHVPAFKTASLLIVAALMVLVTTSTAAIKYAGVNLSCAEFGQNNLPGTYNTHYTYPSQNEVNYFGSKGMNVIRLPFRRELVRHAQFRRHARHRGPREQLPL